MKIYLVKLLTLMTLLTTSCIFTGLSVFLPVTVHNRSELKQVNLGFPLSFVVQNQSALPVGYPDGPSFPIHQTLISPWEYPVKMIWWRFFLDIVVVVIALNLIYLAAKILWQKLRNVLTYKEPSG